MSTGADSGGDDSLGDGRKGGKRELSQSKRAAQNRAAQVRCFSSIQRFRKRSCRSIELVLVKTCDSLVALSILMSSKPAHMKLT
jgi:hypothetical protein